MRAGAQVTVVSLGAATFMTEETRADFLKRADEVFYTAEHSSRTGIQVRRRLILGART
ncbi:hypothetical protein [uncultured Agrobacterium sp.]|uniref:hypothetical protein n=1 Tax=uncultured Agrobacterium sp. TaxID=157277 RepID=UPI0025E661FD|nr:hypothetical protein [uncultured Agrobacterium sp.]